MKIPVPLACVSLVALPILGFGAGCGRATKPAPGLPVGASAFRFVEAPPSPSVRGRVRAGDEIPVEQPLEVLVKARPIPPLVTPAYPENQLGKVRQPVVVAVQLRLDEHGRVSEVRDSLATVSIGGEQTEVFRSVVEEAVRQWRFHPAEVRQVVRRSNGSAGGTYWDTLAVRPTDDACDVAFTFTLKGVVLGGPGVDAEKSRAIPSAAGVRR